MPVKNVLVLVAAVAITTGASQEAQRPPGYLVAVALPILALRLRRTRADRYAGLRSLARD